jgi:hypothetical protein
VKEVISPVLFVAFWELAADVDPEKVGSAAVKLTTSGAYPPKGVKTLYYWLVTAGGKGVTISEADNAEEMYRAYAVWIKECPRVFAHYEAHPAVEIDRAVDIIRE